MTDLFRTRTGTGSVQVFRRTILFRSKTLDRYNLDHINTKDQDRSNLFRFWFRTNSPSKHFVSVQDKINIYFRRYGNLQETKVNTGCYGRYISSAIYLQCYILSLHIKPVLV